MMNVIWMIQTLLSATFITFAAALADRLARRMEWPRRWIWLTAMVLSVALPWASIWVPWGHPVSSLLLKLPLSIKGLLITSAVFGRYVVYLDAVSVSLIPPAITKVLIGMQWTFTAAIILTFVVAIALCVRWHLRVSRSRWLPADLDGVSVLVSPTLGPAVVGLWRPRMIVPAWLLGADAQERRLILQHETQHLLAGDSRLLAIGLLLVAAAPWNILVWRQYTRLRSAVELDCDARVLALGIDLRDYGETLLHVAARAPQVPLLSAALGTTPSGVERRIRAMTAHWRRPHLAYAALVVMLMVGATSTAYEMSARSNFAFDPQKGLTLTGGGMNARESGQNPIVRTSVHTRVQTLMITNPDPSTAVVWTGRLPCIPKGVKVVSSKLPDGVKLQFPVCP